jgi:hypothetical protein
MLQVLLGLVRSIERVETLVAAGVHTHAHTQQLFLTNSLTEAAVVSMLRAF